MDADSLRSPRLAGGLRQPQPTLWQKIKKFFVPVGVVGLLLAKWLAKLKFIFLPLLKIAPFLKTGGTMFVTIWLYSLMWGWWFAFGFVLLILVHECGHLVAAKRVGLKVGAPVFIPFMGAFIALKEAPRNAWIEAQVGIGGPLLGTVGAVGCYGLYLATANPLFRALCYMGLFLNLFNLAPIGFLDGGRIVTALSPWLWVAGTLIILALMIGDIVVDHNVNYLLVFIFIFSLPRLFSLFRKRTEAEARYFEVTPEQRWTMGALYFGLAAFLALAMKLVHFQP
jgi:Zn-dependent protease